MLKARSTLRTTHAERLVRTLIVEAFDEVIELRLLLQEVFAGRPGGHELQVRCMRSCRAFCCGWPGLMRSIVVPSLSHQTDSLEKLKREP